jgi:hypothetical protein
MIKKSLILIGLVVIMATLLFALNYETISEQFDQTPNLSYIMWGACTGSKPQDIDSFESLVEKEMDVVPIFIGWENKREFPLQFASRVKEENKTLLIYWEGFNYLNPGPQDNRFNYDSILNGSWDWYFEEFANDAKNYGGQVIIVPFVEMNLNEFPWSGTVNNNTPEKEIAAYQHIHSFFKDIPNVKFGWAVNSNSIPDIKGNQIEDYYPGDNCVDYVGVDGFNFGKPWRTFDEIFEKPLNKLSKYNKPIFIFSMACADGPKKADWIKQGLGHSIKKYPHIIGWIWFNENKEKNWLVDSNPESLQAFKSILLQY